MRTTNLVRLALATAFLLLIPLVAMQFTDEVAWSLGDFIIAGLLLCGTGIAYEFVASRRSSAVYRAAVGLAVVSALLLIWVNLAVGIIGSEDNPANVMYCGVLAVGFIGAILSRLEPQGLSRVLFAMAIAQTVVTAIGLMIGGQNMVSEGLDLASVLGVNALFVTLFLGSGLLFRQASATQAARASRPRAAHRQLGA